MNTKFILEKAISNDKTFTDVERFVQVFMFIPNALDETFEIRYMIRYMLDGENVSDRFSQVMPSWVISNNDRMMKRSLPEFEPIPNPDFNPEDEFPNEEFLTEPAFDYLKELAEIVPTPALLRNYIAEEDRDGRFD